MTIACLAGPVSRYYPPVAASTHDQDWINRSTAAGVTMATDFRTAAEVTDYIHGDALSANPQWDNTDGIGSSRCLKIPVGKALGENAGNWRRGLNDAWTLRGDGFGATKFYFQFRVKLGLARLMDESTRGSGFKLCNLAGYDASNPGSSDSFTSFEMVIANFFYRGYIEAYRAGGPAGNSDSFTDDPTLVQAMERFDYLEDQWFTIYGAVKIAVYGQNDAGSTGNEFDLYAAGPADTAYTPIYSARNFGIGAADDGYTNGINGMWLSAYDTGRTSSLYETSHKFTQAICSTQPIPPPLPVVSAIQWEASAAENTWGYVPGTATGTIAASGALDTADFVNAWTGQAYDTDNRRIIGAACGGHGDRSQNDVLALPLTGETNAWAQLVGPSGSSADSDPPQNAIGQRGDGSRYADHNYNSVVYANGKVWFPAYCAISGSAGNSSSSVFSWSEAQISNGSLGYEYLGQFDASAFASDGVRAVESGSAYDPIGRKVWWCKQNYDSSAKALVSIDVDTNAITTYAGMAGNGSTFHQLVVHPGKRLLILIGENATYRMDLDSPGTFTLCTESSRPTLSRSYGAVFSALSGTYHGAILVWPNSGTSLSMMTFPETPSGTYAWSTITNAGTAPASPTNGVWKKMGIIPMGDGHDIIVVTSSDTGAVSYLKLPKAGR